MKKYLLTILCILTCFNAFSVEPIPLKKVRLFDGDWFLFAIDPVLGVEVMIKNECDCEVLDWSTNKHEKPYRTEESDTDGLKSYLYSLPNYCVVYMKGTCKGESYNHVMIAKRRF